MRITDKNGNVWRLMLADQEPGGAEFEKFEPSDETVRATAAVICTGQPRETPCEECIDNARAILLSIGSQSARQTGRQRKPSTSCRIAFGSRIQCWKTPSPPLYARSARTRWSGVRWWLTYTPQWEHHVVTNNAASPPPSALSISLRGTE